MSKLDKLRKQLVDFSERFGATVEEKTVKCTKSETQTNIRIVGEKCVIQVEHHSYNQTFGNEKNYGVTYWIIHRDEISPNGVITFGEGKGSKHFLVKTLKKAFQSFATIEGYENFYIM